MKMGHSYQHHPLWIPLQARYPPSPSFANTRRGQGKDLELLTTPTKDEQPTGYSDRQKCNEHDRKRLCYAVIRPAPHALRPHKLHHKIPVCRYQDRQKIVCAAVRCGSPAHFLQNKGVEDNASNGKRYSKQKCLEVSHVELLNSVAEIGTRCSADSEPFSSWLGSGTMLESL